MLPDDDARQPLGAAHRTESSLVVIRSAVAVLATGVRGAGPSYGPNIDAGKSDPQHLQQTRATVSKDRPGRDGHE